MSRTFLSLAVAGVLSIAVGVAVAADLANSKCPISGKAVNPDVTVKYKDVTVGLCCKGCVGAWNKLSDEDKQKKLDGVKAGSVNFAEPVNSKCPMAPSKAVNPAVTTDWNGKTVAFCCKGCKGKFEKLSDEEKAKKLEAAK